MTVEALIVKFEDSRREVKEATEASIKASEHLQKKNEVMAGVQVEVKGEIMAKEKAIEASGLELRLKTNKCDELASTETLQKTELSVLEKKGESNNQSLQTCVKTATELQLNLQKLQDDQADKDRKMSPEDKAKLQKEKEAVLKSWTRFLWAPPVDQLEAAQKNLEVAIKAQKDAEAVLQQTNAAIAAKKAELEKTGTTLASMGAEIKDLREKEATLKGEIKQLKDCLNDVKKEEVVNNVEQRPVAPVDAQKVEAAPAAVEAEPAVIHAPQPEPATAEAPQSPAVTTSFEQMKKEDTPLKPQTEPAKTYATKAKTKAVAS